MMYQYLLFIDLGKSGTFWHHFGYDYLELVSFISNIQLPPLPNHVFVILCK